MESLIAAKVGDTSSLFSDPISVQGNQLIDEATRRFLIVDQKCTGFALIATLSALLLSLPNTLLRKLLSVIVIIVLLQLENLIRINHLHHILVTKEASFHYDHFYVWQGINFVYAIIVFFTTYYMFYSNSRYRKGHSEVG